MGKVAFVVKFTGAGYYGGIHTNGRVISDATKDNSAVCFRTSAAAEACMKRHTDRKGMKKYTIEEIPVSEIAKDRAVFN